MGLSVPTPAEIHLGLQQIANEAFGAAVAWHVVVALAILALLRGWRPSRRFGATLLALPAASVAMSAWVFGNPFNGAVFTGLTLALVALARNLGSTPTRAGPRWAVWFGAAMIAFGWAYPHFLEGRAQIAYLYGAPMGLVPCPTLALTIGFTLLAGGFGSRAWSLVLVAAALFYGVFGAARLGVPLDLGLLVGTIALLVLARRVARTRA